MKFLKVLIPKYETNKTFYVSDKFLHAFLICCFVFLFWIFIITLHFCPFELTGICLYLSDTVHNYQTVVFLGSSGARLLITPFTHHIRFYFVVISENIILNSFSYLCLLIEESTWRLTDEFNSFLYVFGHFSLAVIFTVLYLIAIVSHWWIPCSTQTHQHF